MLCPQTGDIDAKMYKDITAINFLSKVLVSRRSKHVLNLSSVDHERNV